MRGKFITVEGGEGSGKTAAIEQLMKIYSKTEVHSTREPGGTPFAEKLRDLILGESDEEIYTETELMLFYAARSQHVQNVILPKLEKGIHVICDRFSLSTMAYQIYGRERKDLLPFYKKINKVSVGKCVPDLCILFEVDPKEGLRRKANAGGLNRFDKEKLEFHRRLNFGFKKHISDYNNIVIDANKSIEEVQREFILKVREFLN